MTPKFLVCGEALFDIFVTDTGDPACPDMTTRAGGSPMNVAIGLARLGESPAFLSQISKDALGQKLIGILEGEQVDTALVQRVDHSTTLSLVGKTAAGTPDYAFYSMGADTTLRADDIPALPDSIHSLHFGSYSLVSGTTADAVFALAQREQHRFITLDPNVRPNVEPDRAAWIARIDALLPFVDAVKISDEDMAYLYGASDQGDIAQSYLAKGARLVVLTRGSGPASGYFGDRDVAVLPPQTRVVDTVGAGDTFMAMLLSELAALGIDHFPDRAERILHRCATAAAMTCSRAGADLPYRRDLPG